MLTVTARLLSFAAPSRIPGLMTVECLFQDPPTDTSRTVSSRRLLKAAEAIREVVAQAILTELRDPRVKDVTVVGVQVSPDMREAKVAVSVMGGEKQETLSLRGLRNAAGFLQSRIADRIETRYTPKLQFTIDKGQQNAMVVGQLLEQIRREKEEDQRQRQSPDGDETAAGDTTPADLAVDAEADPDLDSDPGTNSDTDEPPAPEAT